MNYIPLNPLSSNNNNFLISGSTSADDNRSVHRGGADCYSQLIHMQNSHSEGQRNCGLANRSLEPPLKRHCGNSNMYSRGVATSSNVSNSCSSFDGSSCCQQGDASRDTNDSAVNKFISSLDIQRLADHQQQQHPRVEGISDQRMYHRSNSAEGLLDALNSATASSSFGLKSEPSSSSSSSLVVLPTTVPQSSLGQLPTPLVCFLNKALADETNNNGNSSMIPAPRKRKLRRTLKGRPSPYQFLDRIMELMSQGLTEVQIRDRIRCGGPQELPLFFR